MKKKLPKSGNYFKPDKPAKPESMEGWEKPYKGFKGREELPEKGGRPEKGKKRERFGGQVNGPDASKAFAPNSRKPGVNKPLKKATEGTAAKPKTKTGEPETVRLNKYMAHAGVASRRKCDELIAAGEVTVNGEIVKEVGHRLNEGDVVKHKGKVLRPVRNLVYVLLNKPKDYITTTSDDKDRRTVMELVSKATEERIYPVGRLDRQTTGLLVMTNDGELALKLSHPSYKLKKIYHATLDKPLTEKDMELIAAGLMLEDGLAQVDKIAWVDRADKTEVGIELHIGKNRIVRRIFEHLGYDVVKLDRVLYGGLTKKDLPRGRWRHLSEKEIIMLKHFT